jgi:transcriptional regulator, propionate catabolism operon regulatory protein
MGAKRGNMPVEADRPPIVWAFSTSRLRHSFESVAASCAGVAEIRVFPQGFEEALRTIDDLIASGEKVDALAAAGANGAYLRDHSGIPVALVSPTAADVVQAVTHARTIARRVAIVSYDGPARGLEQLGEALGLELVERTYVTLEDAKAIVAEVASEGIEVVVGPGPACDLAEAIGLRAVCLYSGDSVRVTLAGAIALARFARAERARRERLRSIIDHLDEGVLTVDAQERIETMNPAAERLLGLTAAEVLGRRLTTVSPGASLVPVLESGSAELDAVEKLGARTLALNRIPLRHGGREKGAILTCQDSFTIQRRERRLRSEHRPQRFVARYLLSGLVGGSPALQQVRALAERYAKTDSTVLVTGESGTGKELVAQGIHNASTRRDRPFVAINCAAFPEALLEAELFGHDEGAFTGSRRGGRPGLFEAAHTGTIFLDELGDVPLPLQTRLLRVLQERQVLRLGSNDPIPLDVRVIAATNRDLKKAVECGQFRGDLYYRLNILHLHLPPLRERPEDVATIAAGILQRALLRQGTPGAYAQALSLVTPHLLRHAWPGNVREVENVLERVAVLFADREPAARVAEEEMRAVLPELFDGPARGEAPVALPLPHVPGLRRVRDEQDRAYIEQVVRQCGGNQSAAAKQLGISRSTLWRKLGGGG